MIFYKYESSESRDNRGRWTSSASGEKLPDHISALKLPPAWRNVEYDKNPNADLLATGVDSKGRKQYVYSERFIKEHADAKFARIEELSKKISEINKVVSKDKSEEAACLHLVIKMGIRPGSDKDTQAKEKAYGATTIEGRHVVEMPNGSVFMRFTGKKGVKLDLPVNDKSIARELLSRKNKAGNDGKLFDTSADKLIQYSKQQDGGGFKTKDFRTLLGTQTAQQAAAAMLPPKTEKEYVKQVKQVAKIVSEKLGNTPAVALSSYIHPGTFAQWRMGLDSKENADGLGFVCNFGTPDESRADWRKELSHENEDDDDGDTSATPDVIGMLGFDPFVDKQEREDNNEDVFNTRRTTI